MLVFAFSSQSHYLNGLDVRAAAVKWLRNNPSFQLPNGTVISDFKEEQFAEWDDYCSYLAKPGVWGDHLTLMAIAERFRLKIVIITSHRLSHNADPFIVVRPITPPPSEQEDRTIYLSHLSELHYGSLKFDDDL